MKKILDPEQCKNIGPEGDGEGDNEAARPGDGEDHEELRHWAFGDFFGIKKKGELQLLPLEDISREAELPLMGDELEEADLDAPLLPDPNHPEPFLVTGPPVQPPLEATSPTTPTPQHQATPPTQGPATPPAQHQATSPEPYHQQATSPAQQPATSPEAAQHQATPPALHQATTPAPGQQQATPPAQSPGTTLTTTPDTTSKKNYSIPKWKLDLWEKYKPPPAHHSNTKLHVEPSTHQYWIRALQRWQQENHQPGWGHPFGNEWYLDLRVESIQNKILPQEANETICRTYLKQKLKQWHPKEYEELAQSRKVETQARLSPKKAAREEGGPGRGRAKGKGQGGGGKAASSGAGQAQGGGGMAASSGAASPGAGQATKKRGHPGGGRAGLLDAEAMVERSLRAAERSSKRARGTSQQT